jgi:AbrB family looped-hinge helix DNA binding protein
MEACLMIVGTVGRRGQITLPKAIRTWLDLQEGDRVVFARRGDEVVLQPLTHALTDFRGSVPVPAPQDFAAVRRQVVETHAREVATGET